MDLQTRGMEGKISTGLGMAAGIVANVTLASFLSAVLIAFCTGAAAYAGQLAIKWMVTKYNKSKKVKR